MDKSEKIAKKAPKIAIIGYGVVGKAMQKLFPETVLYDPHLQDATGTKEQVNACDVAFVCVPTPMKEDGSCDTSIVEEAVSWITAPLIIIRSTVAPGTTDRLIKKYPDKHIVFQPEYIGETAAHPLLNESERTFLIFGGSQEGCGKAVEFYQHVYNASVKILCLTPLEAEIAKYMENCSIANTVTLANEFYNICKTFGVPYDMVREAFLLDPRMSRYFTFVFPDNRGFGGKCLPKDLNAIAAASKQAGYKAEFIEGILKNNKRIRGE